MYYGKLLTIFSKNILQKRKENFKEKLKKVFILQVKNLKTFHYFLKNGYLIQHVLLLTLFKI